MSIRLIADVWDNGPDDPTECNVLVCLANFANDIGQSCRPSIATIARMARRSERTVERTIQTLEISGWLTVERGGGRGNASNYNLDVRRLKGRHDDADSKDKPRHGDGVSGAQRATLAQVKGDTVTLKGDTGAAHIEEPSGTVKGTGEPSTFPEGLSELQYASGIFEHCSIVDTFRIREAASKAIVILARMEDLPLYRGAELMEKRITAAQACGDTTNTFWFEDAKWKQEVTGNGEGKRSPAKDRVDGNRRAIAEALARRGVPGPWDAARADGAQVPESGSESDARRVHDRPGTSSPEILPPRSRGCDSRPANRP